MSSRVALSGWERLIRGRLIDREHAALSELYDHFSASVYGLALRVTRDRHAAEDTTQEVFLRAWQRPSEFDPLRGSLRSWLATMCHSAAVTWVRRRNAERRRQARQAEVIAYQPDVEEIAGALILAEQARAAVALLPAEQRKALELAYLDGFTYRQVGEQLGIPEGTAKSRIRSGLSRVADGLRHEVSERPS